MAAAVAPGEPGFQNKATDVVAAAIWACVAHWEGAPEDALVAAVHYGWDTDTIACMAGMWDQGAPGKSFSSPREVCVCVGGGVNICYRAPLR
jgi:hypothetical protein